MQTLSLRDEQYVGASKKPSLYDLNIPSNWNRKLLIFSHGYMGYKDWGAWNLMEDYFVQRGFGFLKYNVSHNGGTIENGIDFPDLKSFSNNSYSKELHDMESIIDLAQQKAIGLEYLYLIGHSRGGGMVLLQSRNEVVSKIAALAPICDIEKRFPSVQDLEEWKVNGLRYITNGRTKQQMPHTYDQYEDYIQNRSRLNIEEYCTNANVPICVIHGEDDPAVKIEEGEAIANWAGIDLIRIPNEQHTFGARQPWTEKELPLGLKIACEHLLAFFENE